MTVPASQLRVFTRPFWTFCARDCSRVLCGRRSIWARLVYVGLSLAIVVGVQQIEQRLPRLPDPGLTVFKVLMGINAYLAVAQIFGFLGELATERGEGSEGLLRISALSDAELVLSMAAGRYVRLLAFPLLQLPLAALCFFLGKVSVVQILGGYLLLAVGALAVMSAMVYFTGTIRKWPVIAVVGGVILPVAAYCLAEETPAILPSAALVPARYVASVNPLFAFQYLMADGVAPWLGLGVLAGFSAFCIALRAFSEEPGRLCAAASSSGTQQTQAREPRTHRRVPPPLPRVDSSPLAWKERYFGQSAAGNQLWKVIPILAVLFFGVSLLGPHLYSVEFFGQMLAACAAGIFAIFLFAIASSIFGEEVRHETLSSLVVLPIRLSRMAGEKLRVLIPWLVPPVAIYAALGGVLCGQSLWPALAAVNWILVGYALVQVAVFLVLVVLGSLYRGTSRFSVMAFGCCYLDVNVITLGDRLAVALDISFDSLLLGATAPSLLWLVYLVSRIPHHVQLAAAK